MRSGYFRYVNRSLMVAATLGGTLGPPQAAAQMGASSSASQAAIVAKGTAPEMTPFLTDGDGRTLYTLVGREGEAVAICDPSCLRRWRPFLSSERPLARMVLPGLLGTVPAQGGRQVTYRGKSLYYFDGDSKPGDINGQAFAGVGFLVSVFGEVERASADVAAAGPVLPEVIAKGRELFAANCANCHGPQGQGAFGTKLAGFDRLSNGSALVRTIVRGLNTMPAFGPALADDQIAAIATFVRNSWGNSFGAVASEQVKAGR